MFDENDEFLADSLNEIATNLRCDEVQKQSMITVPIEINNMPIDIEDYPRYRGGSIRNGTNMYVRINASYFKVCIVKR
jgi:hypothetical protein